MQTIDAKLKSRIYGSRMGSAFTPNDFLDLGGRDAVDKALSRLAAKGTIRRLSRGLYEYPRQHPELGVLSPDIEKVAKALAGQHRLRLQPAGAYAANLLGLSEQVPARVVFLTDGCSRIVKIGKQEIQLRRTTPRNMASAGRISGLLMQAFRHLGKDHITPARMEHLKRTLPAKERQQLLKDLPLAPAWMHRHFRELADSVIPEVANTSSDVSVLCETYLLKREELGRLTGFSLRALAEWAGGKVPSQPAKRRLQEVRRFLDALSQIVKRERIPGWLHERNKAFDNLTPLQIIEYGEIDRLWAMVHQLGAGSPG